MEELERIQKYERLLAEAQSSADQLQGRIEGLEDELEELTGTKDPAKAARVVDKWEKELEKLQAELEKQLDKIKELTGE
jgi:peptidoglycan hydrolase CwlO-like protein